MFPASGSACVAHDERWCANAPDVACSTREDCPACPSVNGASTACRRLCEPRRLKYYVTPGTGGLPIPRPQLTDLFLDPDEVGLHKGLPGVVRDMSEVTGPYETLLRRLNCCVDDWWSNPKGTGGTLCRDGDTCPADLACDG